MSWLSDFLIFDYVIKAIRSGSTSILLHITSITHSNRSVDNLSIILPPIDPYPRLTMSRPTQRHMTAKFRSGMYICTQSKQRDFPSNTMSPGPKRS